MRVRVTGIAVDGDRILVLNQDNGDGRSWSLPGGAVEPGESMRDALIREMREETGLDVQVGRLLYVCDHQTAHVVHVTFQVRPVGGVIGDITAGTDTRPIRGVEWVKVARLPELGFTPQFQQLVEDGFPDAGSYVGAKTMIGL